MPSSTLRCAYRTHDNCVRTCRTDGQRAGRPQRKRAGVLTWNSASTCMILRHAFTAEAQACDPPIFAHGVG
eukprot:1097702-Pleurochrysis_carterae.AAC.6